MEKDEAGRLLIAKMTELQLMFREIRGYDGPFDPTFPRTVFHMIFCPPLRCSIDPLESYGVLQRLFHSRDGKYLALSFGRHPRFWREGPTGEDVRAMKILRVIRDVAKEHEIWVAFKDLVTGSWFPKVTFIPGMLQPAPGEPAIVPFQEYLERLVEFDKENPPTPGELLAGSVDMNELARFGCEVATPLPSDCRVCALALAPYEAGKDDPRYMTGARRCPRCRTIYVREPADEDLTPEERAKRDERDAVMAEFVKRIADEFPMTGGAVTIDEVAQEGEDEPDKFGLFPEGEPWKEDGQ